MGKNKDKNHSDAVSPKGFISSRNVKNKNEEKGQIGKFKTPERKI